MQKKKINFDSYFASYTKVKWKWIKDVNIKLKIVKRTEENIEEKALWPWVKGKVS